MAAAGFMREGLGVADAAGASPTPLSSDTRRRWTRRRFLITWGIAGAGATLLVACGPGATPAAPTAGAPPPPTAAPAAATAAVAATTAPAAVSKPTTAPAPTAAAQAAGVTP